jgi:GxxExxY protein
MYETSAMEGHGRHEEEFRNTLKEPIIGAAWRYIDTLCHEFTLKNIPFECHREIDFAYKGTVIKGQRMDLLVHTTIVVQIKAV